MNLPIKYSFVAMENHIDAIAIAIDEYLLKLNTGGNKGKKLTEWTEDLNTINNKGKKMQKIKLKQHPTLAPSKEEMNAALIKHRKVCEEEYQPGEEYELKEWEEWDVLYCYIEELHGNDRYHSRYFTKKFLRWDNTPKYSIENMDKYIRNLQDKFTDEGTVTETQYKKFSIEEKVFYHFDLSVMINAKINAYFQRLIDTTDTPLGYFRCAYLANKIGLEREVIFELYKRATTSFVEKKMPQFRYDIIKSNLNALQKTELILRINSVTESFQ